MKRYALLILMLPALCSCRSIHTEHGTQKLKTDIKFNGFSRTYRLHVPHHAGGGTDPKPLIIALHGAFSTAKEFEAQSGLSRLADEQDFYVAYPNGIGLFGKLQHWNAGHCCGKAAKDGVDDVAFIDAVLNDVQANHSIDGQRVYLIGYSNGGMMAYRYAQERTTQLAAAAIVAGALNSTTADSDSSWTPSAPSKPLPILILHGTADEAVPCEGGVSPVKADGRIFTSVQDAVIFWQEANKGQVPVKTVALENWGHNWPGPHFTSDETTQPPMHHYDAATVIWSFFETHQASMPE